MRLQTLALHRRNTMSVGRPHHEIASSVILDQSLPMSSLRQKVSADETTTYCTVARACLHHQMAPVGISIALAAPIVEGGIVKKRKARRVAYDAAFKLKVVREALQRPAGSRIKPTCRDYPDIEPVSGRESKDRRSRRATSNPLATRSPARPPPPRGHAFHLH